MPRILRVLNRLNLGGPAINAAYLTQYLPPDFETFLVAGMIDKHEINSSLVLEKLKIEPKIISSMHRELNPVGDWNAYRQLKKIIRDFNPDIVHTHAAKAGFLARLAASELKVPVVVHTFHGHVFHSYFPKVQTAFFIGLEKWMAKKTNCIIAISESQKKEISEVYRIAPPNKIEIVPLGLDLHPFTTGQDMKREKFRKKFLVDEEDRVIVQVGRLVPVKNHSMLIQVISILQQSGDKKLRFFIVGDGEQKKSLQQLASSLSVDWTEWNENPRRALLTFTSWQHEMDEVYAGADIVSLTSLNEGTPVTLIEAMAANRTIVATQVGGVSDILMRGKFGALADPNDVEGFAEILQQKINNRKEYTNQQARDYAFTGFSYQRLIADMKKLYDLLLNKN